MAVGCFRIGRVEAVEQSRLVWALGEGAEVHIGRAAAAVGQSGDPQLAKEDQTVRRRSHADENKVVCAKRSQLAVGNVALDRISGEG